MYNKYFESFEIGEKWESRGRTITETDLVMFSGLTGDYYPLHTDIEFAGQSIFQQRIAHGMLVLSFGIGLLDMKPGIVLANYGIDRLRFIKPVFIHDTIKVQLEVTELNDKGNGTGVVTAKQSIVKQTGEACIVGFEAVSEERKSVVRTFQHASYLSQPLVTEVTRGLD